MSMYSEASTAYTGVQFSITGRTYASSLTLDPAPDPLASDSSEVDVEIPYKPYHAQKPSLTVSAIVSFYAGETGAGAKGLSPKETSGRMAGEKEPFDEELMQRRQAIFADLVTMQPPPLCRPSIRRIRVMYGPGDERADRQSWRSVSPAWTVETSDTIVSASSTYVQRFSS